MHLKQYFSISILFCNYFQEKSLSEAQRSREETKKRKKRDMSTFTERDLARHVASKPFIRVDETKILRYFQGLGDVIISELECNRYIRIPFLGTFGVGNKNVGVATFKRTYFFVCDKSFTNLNKLRVLNESVPKKQSVMLDYGAVGSRCGLDCYDAKSVHCEIFASLSEMISSRMYEEGNIRLGSLGALRLRLSFVKTAEFVFSMNQSSPYVTNTMKRPKPYNYSKLINRNNLYQTKEQLQETMRTKRGLESSQMSPSIGNTVVTSKDGFKTNEWKGNTYNNNNDYNDNYYYNNSNNNLNDCISITGNSPSSLSSRNYSRESKRGYDSPQKPLSSRKESRQTPRKIPLDINYEDIDVGIDLARRATAYNQAKLDRLNNKIEEHTQKTGLLRDSMLERIDTATRRVNEIKGYAPNDSMYYRRTIADGIDNLGFQASQKYSLSTPPRDRQSGYFDLDKTMEDKTKTMTVCNRDFNVTTTRKATEPYSRWDVKMRCPDCGQMHMMIPHEE